MSSFLLENVAEWLCSCPYVLDRANKLIGEVKNVYRLSYTDQLKDFVAFAQQEGYDFVLYVREETKLSGPLQELVKAGAIILERILP